MNNEMTITIPSCDDINLLSPKDVAERLATCGALTLDDGDRTG